MNFLFMHFCIKEQHPSSKYFLNYMDDLTITVPNVFKLSLMRWLMWNTEANVLGVYMLSFRTTVAIVIYF